ncbi:flagellar export chaperone FliS [Clostridium sartagoforme]|jgi:flagellar secretion chaperone FliS|uniref:flagellar export chaperone FliS n=1 Tax=Clostridium sartagoforme TaxID=84031 RepID=UPI0031D473CE
MYGNNALNVYKNNSVNYASKEQLLLMLVDGAVKFAKMAKQALEDKNVIESHKNLVKVQDIFTELMISLDKNAGDWANQIYKVYDFIKTRLFEINLKKDAEMLEELMPVIEDVRDIWHEAYEISRKSR